LRYQRDGFSVEAARKKGRALPPDHWFLNPPPEFPGADWFYTAYRDLSTCRPADGPIPWTAAMAYADRKGVAPDVAETLWAVIRQMDNAERGWRLDEIESGGASSA
jgi:hypothetical protein